MIDGFGPCAPLSLWSESMSPEECYYFMYGVPFDFIIGGRERPAEPEPEPEPELGPDGFPEIILDKWTGVATYSFSFLSPDGKQVVTLNDCLWNEKVKPEEGEEPVSARYLTEKGYKQLTGPTFEYDTDKGCGRGLETISWKMGTMKRKVEKGKPWQGKRQYSVVPLFWKSVKRSVFYNWLTRFQTPAETKMVVRMLAAFW